MKISIDKNIFNEAYLPHLFDYSHRYNVYYGGRCSGKSYFISDKLLILGLSEKRRMVFLTKLTNKVEDSIWTLFIDSLIKFKMYDKCKINKSNHTVELPNGTTIKMTGLDTPEKAKTLGVNIDTIWIEEASDFTNDDIELLDGTLRGSCKTKQMYFSFNPVSMDNYVYTRFGFDKSITPPDTFILKTTYLDNKYCDEATIKRLEALKERNPSRYKIEAEGDFATLDKLVYPDILIQDFDYLALLRSTDKNLYQIYGMDFGYINDYTALVCAIADNTNMILYIYDEYYQKGMLTSDIIKMITNKQLHKTNIICDRQEARLIEELNKGGIKAKKCNKGKGSIMQGINKIQEYKIVVLPRCTNIITELQNYCYQKEKSTGQYINKPIDKFNHGLDALRYGIQSMKQKANIITSTL